MKATLALEIKLCECGCGNPAPIARATVKRYGHIKGQPCRFIYGHVLKTLSGARVKGERHPCWKGGTLINFHGYEMTKNDDHPRANSWGYIPSHILIAEKAFGKPLPLKGVIHHFPDKTNFTHLIICQDNSYHLFLHRRFLALKASGHADWKKCFVCKKYDDPKNLSTSKRSGSCHPSCARVYALKRYYSKKGEKYATSFNFDSGKDQWTFE